MHICHVISVPFPPEEGIGRYVYDLSTKLIEKGHKVTIITRRHIGETKTQLVDNINVIRATFIPIYPFYIQLHGLFVNRVLKFLKKQIDIVHVHTPLPPLVKTSLPVITTIHSPMLVDTRYTNIRNLYTLFSKISARCISYPLELKIIQSSDIVTTVSKPVALELKEYHINPEDIIVIYNGVNEKNFCPITKKSNNDIKYILFAGRIDRQKGLFDLVECAEYICKERADISFIIAGKGRDLKKLKDKTKKAGLQDRFIFLGQVNKNTLLDLYQKTSIFILPSYHEGLPGALLEAMSCGLPIIATDVRGNKDLINNRENGIIIPTRSPKKMAEAINILIEDENLRKKLGKNARKTIEQKYTWSEVSNNILRCYELLLKDKYKQQNS